MKKSTSTNIMNAMKKCTRRCVSAGLFNTSSAGAYMLPTLIITAICSIALLSNLNTSNTHAAASTLTISVSDSIGLNIVPTSDNGTFMTSSTSTNNVSVSTTHGTGYTLGIKASTASSNALVNSTDSNKTIPSITSSISESTFSSSSSYNNTWGYRPSKYNSSANSNYLQAPTSTTATTIDATSSSNSTANNYNIAIGARITNTTTSGTYNNTFIFTVTANPSIYSITYNANGGSGAPSNVSNQTTTGSSVTLSSTTPTWSNHTFQGWCTTQVAVGASCTGTSYSAGSSWTIDQTASSSSLTLYARWTEDKTWFQNATMSDCGKTMYDNRGTSTYKNVAYTTAKINGQCWMTRNLDLPGDTALTSDDTNLTTGFTLPASSTSGFNSYNTDYVYNSNRTDCSSPGCYSYYSWYTATAHWGTYSVSSGSSPVDICPKGWRLPTIYEYISLKNIYTSGPALTASPWLGVYAGTYYNNGSFGDGGSYGYYWSSTAEGSDYADSLYFSRGSANPTNSKKHYGFSVRCVMKSPTMQSQTAASLAALMPNNGDTATLSDSRDGNEYSIAKIGGKYWMTKNLMLGGSSTMQLTPADSNVPAAGYTLRASSTSGFSDYTTGWVYNAGDRSCSSSQSCYGYYSYAAATAGTNPSSSDSSYDICPAGWRLPTKSEYDTLRGTYTTGAILTASPWLGVYAGFYDNGSFFGGGSYGYYWSSTAYSSYSVYFLDFYSSGASTDYSNKRGGFSIRCLAKS